MKSDKLNPTPEKEYFELPESQENPSVIEFEVQQIGKATQLATEETGKGIVEVLEVNSPTIFGKIIEPTLFNGKDPLVLQSKLQQSVDQFAKDVRTEIENKLAENKQMEEVYSFISACFNEIVGPLDELLSIRSKYVVSDDLLGEGLKESIQEVLFSLHSISQQIELSETGLTYGKKIVQYIERIKSLFIGGAVSIQQGTNNDPKYYLETLKRESDKIKEIIDNVKEFPVFALGCIREYLTLFTKANELNEAIKKYILDSNEMINDSSEIDKKMKDKLIIFCGTLTKYMGILSQSIQILYSKIDEAEFFADELTANYHLAQLVVMASCLQKANLEQLSNGAQLNMLLEGVVLSGITDIANGSLQISQYLEGSRKQSVKTIEIIRLQIEAQKHNALESRNNRIAIEKDRQQQTLLLEETIKEIGLNPASTTTNELPGSNPLELTK